MSFKTTTLDFWSESKIALRMEVAKHPWLEDEIHLAYMRYEIRDYADLLAFLCTKFNTVVHGDYTPEDIKNLEIKLYNKLVAHRCGLVTPPIGTPLN